MSKVQYSYNKTELWMTLMLAGVMDFAWYAIPVVGVVTYSLGLEIWISIVAAIGISCLISLLYAPLLFLRFRSKMIRDELPPEYEQADGVFAKAKVISREISWL